MPELFVDGRRKAGNGETETAALFEEIGQPKVELGWLKKSWHARLRICALWSTGARNGGQHHLGFFFASWRNRLTD
jgi:hypothetical protein